MNRPISRVLVGADPALAERIFRLAAALSLTAAGPVVVPRLWTWAGLPGEVEAVRLAAAVGFLVSVLAASYLLARAGDLRPSLPIAAVGVVLLGSWLTGQVTDAELVFLLGPALMLGVLAALAAYANNGAVAALSLVFVPVFVYIINAPGGLPAGLAFGTRLRLSLLFSLLFTLSIGSAGFLLGSWVRWLIEYVDLHQQGRLTPVETVGDLFAAADELREPFESGSDIDDSEELK